MRESIRALFFRMNNQDRGNPFVYYAPQKAAKVNIRKNGRCDYFLLP